jgi:ADP-ribose pyrophosphatase YjhB (NUDIX family)
MRQASRAIIINDDKLLVTKRNKFGSEYYILVGGGVEIGESLEQAMYRELQEESGVEVANPRVANQPYILIRSRPRSRPRDRIPIPRCGCRSAKSQRYRFAPTSYDAPF